MIFWEAGAEETETAAALTEYADEGGGGGGAGAGGAEGAGTLPALAA